MVAYQDCTLSFTILALDGKLVEVLLVLNFKLDSDKR